MCSQHWDQIVCMTNLTHPLGVYYSRNCSVACLTGLWCISKHSDTLLFHAVNNNRLPETTRPKSVLQAPGVQAHNCFTHWSADMSTCTVSIRRPVSVVWSFLYLRHWPRLISASFPPKWIQEREKWPHVCACQKDYLFSQSVTVCSMYIDDPSLCIY